MTTTILPDISQVLFFVFLGAGVVQLLYYLVFYSGVFSMQRDETMPEEKLPVSVIIAARNESDNLGQFLTTVLEQDYPQYEVIVVNDASTDDTADVLSEFKARYDHLKVTHVPYDPRHHIGKKLALTVGIKAASHEQLVFTDADCMPRSKQWLHYMQRHFVQKKALVLGYGGYLRKPGILNRLIRFDAAFIGMQYLTFAMRGIPYMGVGRNLAYSKTLFYTHRGFGSSMYMKSGDDDLFVNKLTRDTPCAVEPHPDAQVLSEPVKSFWNWRKQKQRHLSTSWHYKLKHKILLFLEPFSRTLFYISFIGLMLFPVNILMVSGVFLLRLILQQSVFAVWFGKTGDRELMLYSIFLDVLLPGIYVVFLLSNSYLKRNKWH